MTENKTIKEIYRYYFFATIYPATLDKSKEQIQERQEMLKRFEEIILIIKGIKKGEKLIKRIKAEILTELHEKQEKPISEREYFDYLEDCGILE